MKRNIDEDSIPYCGKSYYQTYFSLLSHADIIVILQSSCNDTVFAKVVQLVFKDSFVIIDKLIYNKTIINTLSCIGTLNSLGVCVVRHLVRLL